MQKQNLIRYFLLMVTITLVGCQTTPPKTETNTPKGQVNLSDTSTSRETLPLPTPRTCWTKVSQPIENSGQQTFLLAMGANTGDLKMANHDAMQFKQAMQQRYSVPENHICLLDDVYRAEFEQALEDLKHWVKPDDRVIIFFSGHGSYVKDDNGDEKSNAQNDKWDEVFVTLDVKDLEDPNRKNVVTDDEFIEWVNALPTERIITFIDACHSGGMNLGIEDKLASHKMRAKFFFKGKIGTFLSSLLFNTESEQTAGGLEQRIKGVVLAATQEEKMACENDEGGIFTTSFLKQFQHKPKASFYQLFKNTKTQMQQAKIVCDRYYQEPGMIGKFLSGD